MDRSKTELMAANLHAKGDTFYHAEMYTTAYIQYTNSIQYWKIERNKIKRSENLKKLFAKRSLTCLKMGNFKKCLEDAQCALKMQHNDEDVCLNELMRIRKIIIENVLKTDLHLSSIPEDVELVNKPIELDAETLFDFDEAIIMKSSLEKVEDNNNNNNDGDLDKSACLEDLLEDCEQEEDDSKIITIESVMLQLSMIDDDDEDDNGSGEDSDSTLTDNTLKFTDFAETDISFLCEEDVLQ